MLTALQQGAPQPVTEAFGVARLPTDQSISGASRLLQDHGLAIVGSRRGSVELAFAGNLGVMEEIVPYFEASSVAKLQWYEDGKCKSPSPASCVRCSPLRCYAGSHWQLMPNLL